MSVIPAADNPWGVDVLDLRASALGWQSTTRSQEVAERFGALRGEDGRAFAGAEPEAPDALEADGALVYPADPELTDGVLFAAAAMEDKWALFLVEGRLVVVRSWTGEVAIVADAALADGSLHLSRVRGRTWLAEPSPTGLVRELDALVRNHAWDEPWPVPLEPPLEASDALAQTVFVVWGRRGQFASVDAPSPRAPAHPLRSTTPLHRALVRRDRAAVDALLAEGRPPGARCRRGLPTLTWALSDLELMGCLVDAGCPVDVRSDEGATALMNAVQAGSDEAVAWLLARGADADARDLRGFTALHRAAELGHAACAVHLLDAGADPTLEAHGHTPCSLAAGAGNDEVAALLGG